MMKSIATIAALVAAIPYVGAMAVTLSPTPVFEGTATTLARNGTTQSVHISIQAWAIAGRDYMIQELPIRGFYVAHLISGQVVATIDGQTAEHDPGDYWSIKPGRTMQVKAIGDIAVLETIVVSNP
jgi:quercetin dioxygenase-like cupin family protein